jgi:CheY-like chemotaxis protein/class 3 adenylate cyclase
MDIQLPDLDGISALGQLRADAALAGTPIIAISASVMPDEKQKIVASGFDAYITKPINVKQFLETVERQLAKAEGAGVSATILVVDDVATNVKLLADLLAAKGYRVVTAASGNEALARIESDRPSLVLLDVMMPNMSGYEVCQAIRANPEHGILPVVLITALDPDKERIRGLEAGADDFLTKPVNQAELMARVKSLLRIKALYDEVQHWNRTLEQRVAEAIAQMERLGRLKRFFSPQLAELIVNGGAEDPLRSHRREITVVFVDLRGYTSFNEAHDPEEVMAVLREYHAAMGAIILEHAGTLERFAGDGMMIFFNDPAPVPDPAERAVRMALAMQRRFAALSARWGEKGHELHMGIGIAQGPATLGAIGFEGRIDYGAVGPVCNLGARLCGEARGGEILLCARVRAAVESTVATEAAGALNLKGFQHPVAAFRLVQ